MSAAQFEEMMDKIMAGYFDHNFIRLFKEEELSENFKKHILPILNINFNSVEEHGKKHYFLVVSIIIQNIYRIIFEFRSKLVNIPDANNIILNQGKICKEFDGINSIKLYYDNINSFNPNNWNKKGVMEDHTVNEYKNLYDHANKSDSKYLSYEASFKIQLLWEFVKNKKFDELFK